MDPNDKIEKICPCCNEVCDPDVCWCGDYEENHGTGCGHGFVPWGCVCGYVTKPEVKHEKETNY